MSFKTSNYSYSCETNEDDGSEYIAENFKAFDPSIIVPTDSVECTPETVGKVEPKGSEPNYIDNNYYWRFESLKKKYIRISQFFMRNALELKKLHICPEVSQVETKYTKNDDTKNKHIL